MMQIAEVWKQMYDRWSMEAGVWYVFSRENNEIYAWSI